MREQQLRSNTEKQMEAERRAREKFKSQEIARSNYLQHQYNSSRNTVLQDEDIYIRQSDSADYAKYHNNRQRGRHRYDNNGYHRHNNRKQERDHYFELNELPTGQTSGLTESDLVTQKTPKNYLKNLIFLCPCCCCYCRCQRIPKDEKK